MKRYAMITLAIVLALSLCACGGSVRNATLDYGSSAIFSHDDIDGAAQVVYEQFAEFDGCVLHSLTYAGDERSADNIDYCRSLASGAAFTECIVFDSSFRSPVDGGGAWNANDEYTWSWYLAREAGGGWELLTYGYA